MDQGRWCWRCWKSVRSLYFGRRRRRLLRGYHTLNVKNDGHARRQNAAGTKTMTMTITMTHDSQPLLPAPPMSATDRNVRAGGVAGREDVRVRGWKEMQVQAHERARRSRVFLVVLRILVGRRSVRGKSFARGRKKPLVPYQGRWVSCVLYFCSLAT